MLLTDLSKVLPKIPPDPMSPDKQPMSRRVIHMSKYFETALTSIGCDFDEVCMVASDIMQKKLKNKFYKNYQNITITGKLFLRETVDKAKK